MSAIPMTIKTATSPWRVPQISGRWLPVFRRNLLAWRKMAIPSLVGNIAEPLITLVAFGYGLGTLIGQVQLNGTTIPYILFLASGSICSSAMNAASFEALYSAFSRMHVQRTWDGIMNAAHSISANTTSSSRTGAFMMPSQVRCTCMREKAEYSASNDAAFIALEQIEPLARNRM